MVAQLDNGSAFAAAGIAAQDRGLQVDASFAATGTTLTYTRDLGSATSTDLVPNSSGTAAGSYVFGSYLAPSWLTANGDIPQTPTADAGPVVQGQARLPFVAILPAGPAPAGGWPVTVFGHGFTRTDTDLFLAASQNALRGVATIATDVVGHGYGPRSTWNVISAGVTTTVPVHARGVDQDGNGVITSTEGVATLPQPAPLAQINSRDGLRQTVADVSTLVRAVAQAPTLAGAALRPVGLTYYGQSFGGPRQHARRGGPLDHRLRVERARWPDQRDRPAVPSLPATGHPVPGFSATTVAQRRRRRVHRVDAAGR